MKIFSKITGIHVSSITQNAGGEKNLGKIEKNNKIHINEK